MIFAILLFGLIKSDRCSQWYLKYETIYECLDDNQHSSSFQTTSSVVNDQSTQITTASLGSTSASTSNSEIYPDYETTDEMTTPQLPKPTSFYHTTTSTTTDLVTQTFLTPENRFENETNSAGNRKWWKSPFGVIGLM